MVTVAPLLRLRCRTCQSPELLPTISQAGSLECVATAVRPESDTPHAGESAEGPGLMRLLEAGACYRAMLASRSEAARPLAMLVPERDRPRPRCG